MRAAAAEQTAATADQVAAAFASIYVLEEPFGELVVDAGEVVEGLPAFGLRDWKLALLKDLPSDCKFAVLRLSIPRPFVIKDLVSALFDISRLQRLRERQVVRELELTLGANHGQAV